MDDLLLLEIAKALRSAVWDGDKIMLDNEDEVLKTISAKASKYYGRRIEDAKREEREGITKIIKEYKLDKYSGVGDLLKKQANGWRVLKQALEEIK